MHKYPTNLTDKQWQVIKNMLDPKERFRKYSLRSVFDGILYIVKTGVQWRMLPSDFAPRHCAASFRQGGESQPWNHRLEECQDLPPCRRPKGDRRQQKDKGKEGAHSG